MRMSGMTRFMRIRVRTAICGSVLRAYLAGARKIFSVLRAYEPKKSLVMTYCVPCDEKSDTGMGSLAAMFTVIPNATSKNGRLKSKFDNAI